MSAPLTQEAIKDILGKKAAALVEPGMVVGLGTGTTAHQFILHLAERCKTGLSITAVASSERSAQLAKSKGIPQASIEKVEAIDLTVDGADEVDASKRMIKGGGGALLREKIVAYASRKVVILADASKVVARLGKHPLPVEVVPFGHEMTKRHIESLGHKAAWRTSEHGTPWMSDNGNYILDILFAAPLTDPETEERRIATIPGIVETGFFFDIADEVLIGYPDGRIASL